MRRLRFLVCVAVLTILAQPAFADDDDKPLGGPEVFKHLKYRSIGPAIGGRVSRSVGVPGDPLIYYMATASGGVWKSTDAGLTWKPIFDEQSTSSIGSIALAPSNPNVLYVGTGEANIRGNVAAGNGIYKSLDAGKTWTHVWKQEGQIGATIVHPTNPDIAFAAVLGHAFGPNPERGVYRTTDGGKTWRAVLVKNPDTGACDVCFDPSNPNVLFAGLWQTRRRPWELTSGGPGSGLYVSRDGGDTWKQLGGTGVTTDKLHGLPEGIYGRVGVAVAPSDSRRIYALIEADKGGLFRSDDGGVSWDRINAGHFLTQRIWYFGTVHVDPTNADVVWCPNVRLLKSVDAGKTFKQVKGTHHVDHHDLWIDPKNPKRMIDSNDGGVDITSNSGESWYAPPLPICQFYHINVDNRVPYYVSGTMQDIGTGAGPSNSLRSDGIAVSDWHGVGGGETGFTAHDPSDPNIVYAGEYGGYISRYDQRTRQARNISIYPTNPSGHGAADLRYRFQWTAPILLSPHDPKTIYHGGNVLFRTTDGGQRWSAISSDLTRNDKTKQQWSGGPITGDNTTAEYYCTIFALAESPRHKGLLWAGSDDGLVHVSRDAGKTWSNVTKNLPALPEWGTVCCIEPSRFDDETVYLVVDAHRLDDVRPYLWKTTDLGKTWKSLTGKLSQDVYLHVVREDPKQKGLLYLGTERGVSFSTDDGASWQELKLNLPTVAVTDLVVKDNDLVVGTNGRSIWIFDDLTPIREYTSKVAANDVHLFSTQPTIQWRYHSPIYSRGDKQAGANPPNGAVFHYFLKNKATAESEVRRQESGVRGQGEDKAPVLLEILDGDGKVIRTLGKKEEDDVAAGDPDGPEDPPKKKLPGAEPGVHRFVWDLRHEGTKRIHKAKFDGGNPKIGPSVLPGAYSIRLVVNGKTATGKFEVKADPRVQLADAERGGQLRFALTIREDISRLAGLVETLRAVRKQLAAQADLLADKDDAKELVKDARALVRKLDELEGKMHNPKAEVSYDILAQKGGAQLYSQLVALYDWAHDGDGPPTQGMREVYAEQAAALKAREADLKELLAGDLARYNEFARKRAIPNVIVPGGK